MGARFEELDWRPTPMGAISLRRRCDPGLDIDVFEVKLDDDYLMSSLFTAGEIELARLGLAAVRTPDSGADAGLGADAEGEAGLDVLVGGLGLGYTAGAVLEDPRVRSLVVAEALGEVIDWHRRGLVPLGAILSSDPRCRFVNGDFFAMATETAPSPGAEELWADDSPVRFHAVLVDIDHSPRHLLHPDHAAFYRPEGLRELARRLRPGGVFALWSNDPPDAEFSGVLAGVFDDVRAQTVDIPGAEVPGGAINTVYVASLAL